MRERGSFDGPVVSCEALTKRYGEFLALDGVTFSLPAGTVTGFLGPNGAGKTTTLKVLLGLAAPTSGAASIFGCRYRDLDDPARRVGAVLEVGDLHPGRSGWDHLRWVALAAGLDSDRIGEVVDLVELGAAARRRGATDSPRLRPPPLPARGPLRRSPPALPHQAGNRPRPA